MDMIYYAQIVYFRKQSPKACSNQCFISRTIAAPVNRFPWMESQTFYGYVIIRFQFNLRPFFAAFSCGRLLACVEAYEVEYRYDNQESAEVGRWLTREVARLAEIARRPGCMTA